MNNTLKVEQNIVVKNSISVFDLVALQDFVHHRTDCLLHHVVVFTFANPQEGVAVNNSGLEALKFLQRSEKSFSFHKPFLAMFNIDRNFIFSGVA